MSEGSLSERLSGKTKITGEQLAVCALFFGVDEGVFYRDPDSFRRRIMGGGEPELTSAERAVSSVGELQAA